MRDPFRRLTPVLLLISLATLSASCERCDPSAGPRVPFKLAPSDGGTESQEGAVSADPLSATYARDAGSLELDGIKLPFELP